MSPWHNLCLQPDIEAVDQGLTSANISSDSITTLKPIAIIYMVSIANAPVILRIELELKFPSFENLDKALTFTAG